MLVNPQKIVSMSEANQNFSKIATSEEEKLDEIMNKILFENLEALKELAK